MKKTYFVLFFGKDNFFNEPPVFFNKKEAESFARKYRREIIDYEYGGNEELYYNDGWALDFAVFEKEDFLNNFSGHQIRNYCDEEFLKKHYTKDELKKYKNELKNYFDLEELEI